MLTWNENSVATGPNTSSRSTSMVGFSPLNSMGKS